jgi:hypothetical protein
MVVGPMAGSNGAYLPGLAEMKKDFGARSGSTTLAACTLAALMHTRCGAGCKLYCHASERERVAKQISLATDDLCGLEQGTSLKLGSGSSIEVCRHKRRCALVSPRLSVRRASTRRGALRGVGAVRAGVPHARAFGGLHLPRRALRGSVEAHGAHCG